MRYSRDQLLMLKSEFIEKPKNFDKIYEIFNKEIKTSKFWKPNEIITNEHEKIKKNTFNILNKLSLENFSKMSKSLLLLLKQTNDEMISLFIKQMIDKCATEKTYNSLYVELYNYLKPEINNFEEHFLERLQELYEQKTDDELYSKGIMILIINLYKKGIIKEFIIHDCLKQYFEKKMFENICILFTECGKYLDHSKAKIYNKTKYFDKLYTESLNKDNGMRICFKIQDLLTLYENKWLRR